MRKYALLSLALTAICFANEIDTPESSETQEISSQVIQAVSITDLADTDLLDMVAGKRPDLIVEFPAQMQIPLTFYLKGSFIHLLENDEKWGALEIQQTFYAKCNGTDLFLSSNLTDWKPFMEFLTGTASAILSIEDGQPFIVVGSEVTPTS